MALSVSFTARTTKVFLEWEEKQKSVFKQELVMGKLYLVTQDAGAGWKGWASCPGQIFWSPAICVPHKLLTSPSLSLMISFLTKGFVG